jgi:secondary thiamine-phosphate synthase enzyme
MLQTYRTSLNSKGFNQIHEITDMVQSFVSKSNFNEGNVLCFVYGSTASITTVEYEPGLLKDIPEALEIIAPMNKSYHHDNTWHDGNGYAHIRASFLGPSLVVPFLDGKLLLGTWQQIILIDFDNKPRKREVVIQVNGE